MATQTEKIISAKPDNNNQEVLITRIFDAPREIVFKAWSEPEQLLQWFAPRGCTIEFRQLDFREGGQFHSCISNPKYHDCWCIGTYREIVVPERIVYSIAIADKEGNRADPLAQGMDPDWPAETIVSIDLEKHGKKTKLALRQTVNESLAKRTGAYPSWLEMFDRLNELLIYKP